MPWHWKTRLAPSLVSLSVFFPAYNLSVTHCNQPPRVQKLQHGVHMWASSPQDYIPFLYFELQPYRTSSSPPNPPGCPHLCTLPPRGCHLPNLAPKSGLANVYLSSAQACPPSHVWRPLLLSDSEGNSSSFGSFSCASLSPEEPTPLLLPGQESGSGSSSPLTGGKHSIPPQKSIPISPASPSLNA